MRPAPTRRTAFTLIELIIIIVVLGLLAGIGVLAYTSVVTISQDKAAKLALTDVAREASALAAQNGESEWSEDDWTTALADATAGPALSGGGVTAANTLALVNTAADSTNSSSMSYGKVSLQTRAGGIAGLAMKTASGHCAFVRAVLPQQVTAWTTASDVGGNCLASVGLDGGPSGSYTYTATATNGATPLAPTGLTATVAGSAVNLAWATTSGASSYTVYRSADGGSTWTKTPGITATSWTDTAATAGGTFTYQVSATATNESPKSASASATLLPAAPTLIATPSGTSATLSWNTVAGASGFDLYKDGSATAITLPASTTSYTDTGLPAGTHTYQVSATNAAGEGPRSGTASVTFAPSTPANFAAANTAANPPAFTWTASVGAANYSVYRDGVLLTTLSGSATSFSDPTAVAQTGYQYSIDAYNTAGHSGQTAAISVVPGSSYAKAVLADNPTGYWRLDETSGTTLRDFVHGNTGTLAGSPVLGQPGATANTNKAVDVTSGYAYLYNRPASNGVETVEFWMKYNNLTANQMPVSFNGAYDLYSYGGSVLGFNSGNGDVYGISMAAVANGSGGTYALTAGTWYHVVVEVHGGDYTQNKMWINGVPQALAARTGGTQLTGNTGLVPAVEVSGWQGGSSMDFAGVVDDVSIWNGTLTNAQVAAHYAAR